MNQSLQIFLLFALACSPFNVCLAQVPAPTKSSEESSKKVPPANNSKGRQFPEETPAPITNQVGSETVPKVASKPLSSWAFMLHPISIVFSAFPDFKWFAVDTEFGVSESVTMGPTIEYNAIDSHSNPFSYDSPVEDYSHAWLIGLRTNFFMTSRRFESGFYISLVPGIVSVREMTGSGQLTSSTFVGFNSYIGYGWYNISGGAFRLGIGPSFWARPSDLSKASSSLVYHGRGGYMTEFEFAMGLKF